MSLKRRSQENASYQVSPHKVRKNDDGSYFKNILQESGLILCRPPDKCIVHHDLIIITRNIKRNLEKHFDYPRNVSTFFTGFEEECKDTSVFKYYLFPNIIRLSDEQCEKCLNESLVKILLSIPIIQNKLSDFIFEKALDLATASDCGPWIQMILKCFSSLDNLVDGEKISTNLINLLDVTQEKMVRLEIITAIPDIIGDQEHDSIATEMSRIMSEDGDLIPAILDCLSYLCLSDEQYEQLQRRTLNILMTLSQCNNFPNFVKFLLMSGTINDNSYTEVVQGIRNALKWSTSITKPQDIATSQILTAAAIRNSMISSKAIANAWTKVILNCRSSTDHKPIDFILILIMYSSTEDKQKQIENILRKQIKFGILKESLIDEAFEKFTPILKENVKFLISLTNCLLKSNAEPILHMFASHIYMQMFSKLEGCTQTIVAELLQLGLDCKTCVMNILLILNSVASKDLKLLKPQSVQMLTLLDRMDTMSLCEIRATMDLLCGLAYGVPNSVIRDDIHMIIRKELSSSDSMIKVQGILAGIYAVKYLMVSHDNEDESIELPENISYSLISHLSEGDIREAAQIIELISRSTRQFPHMIVFFYDELGQIMQSTNDINKHFLAWITEAVTNDLQQNFIVDSLESVVVKNMTVDMQYCLNTDSEMDDVIAINIVGLVSEDTCDVNISVLPPLFQVVQILHSKQHKGNLSSIDALLGCPVVMPVIDLDSVEDMPNSSVINTLDCLVHCINWFTELINAFCSQSDPAIKSKIFPRIMLIEKLENLIEQILIKSNVTYKPPLSLSNINNIIGNVTDKKLTKNPKQKKKTVNEDSTIADTVKSQATQNNPQTLKNKLELLQNIPFRPFSLDLMNILKSELSEDDDAECNLTIKTLTFVFKYTNKNLENILVSKIKRNTFLNKHQDTEAYNYSKAENCAKNISILLPQIMGHFQFITTYIDNYLKENIQNDSGYFHSVEVYQYVLCLEYVYNFLNIYFRWIGFKNGNTALLRSSLRTIANIDNDKSLSLKENVFSVAKYLQKQTSFCLQLSTAVAIIDLLSAISEHSSSSAVIKIIKEMSSSFLAKQWKTSDGIVEKGLIFNQNIDHLAKAYFIHNEILALKQMALLLVNEVQALKSPNNTLDTFKCINKSNFPILYKNLGLGLYEVTKSKLDKGLTNAEHINLWKDVAVILKCMSEMTKALETRNNLTAFFKKCLPIIKLFNTQGIPIFDIEFKNKTQEIIEILKILQQTTRFLQSLCCHSHLKKDTVLMSKVPYMRQLLETLIYKIKAMLIANKCSEAFWMGNLKNKDIHGEIIASQQSVDEDTVEDCDDQLPEDDSDNTDDEMINPDSKSLSDIV